MLFENVNDEGMRRRRCIWRRSIGHPAYVLGLQDLGTDAQCACQNYKAVRIWDLFPGKDGHLST